MQSATVNNLIICIRQAGVRLRNANRKEQTKRPFRWKVLSPLRIFRPLTMIPLSRFKHASFYLPAAPKPNSKAEAVVKEFHEKIPYDEILAHDNEADNEVSVRTIRFLIRFPWALAFLWKIRGRCQRLDEADLQTLLCYALYRRWLRRRPNLIPIIISDISPGLHALWCAAAAEGNRALWWQDDFHHYSRLPYPIIGAAVINERGLDTVKMCSGGTVIARRKTEKPCVVKPIPGKPNVGIATNASFILNEQSKQHLNELILRLNVEKLNFRLHPNSKLSQLDFEGMPVYLAPKDEPMKEFAERIDIAVVGNSAAQLWLVRHGVPVVHVPGLDENGYDLYRYVAERFVYGISDISDIQLENIKDFYASNSDHYKAILNYTTVNDKSIEGLGVLVKLING